MGKNQQTVFDILLEKIVAWGQYHNNFPTRGEGGPREGCRQQSFLEREKNIDFKQYLSKRDC